MVLAMTNRIGALNEQPLHAALKAWYAGDDGQVEVAVDNYIIDVIKDGRLIEIQTGSFSSIKTKLIQLADNHHIKLVFPIADQKWLLKLPKDKSGQIIRRKSPKREDPAQIFNELVSFPELLTSERFSVELAIIHEEEVRRYTGEKPWRRNGWIVVEKRLVEVIDTVTYENGFELMQMLPAELPEPFTTADMAKAMGQPRWLAQKAAYCLRRIGVVDCVGKRSRSKLYRRNWPSAPAA